ncbi:MAG: hypothetical protein FGM57_00390 [Candidatus Taylorbacteria bacterium]|nr:hypothetical protein [Candidatus Taylorbacteria bacterium]
MESFQHSYDRPSLNGFETEERAYQIKERIFGSRTLSRLAELDPSRDADQINTLLQESIEDLFKKSSNDGVFNDRTLRTIAGLFDIQLTNSTDKLEVLEQIDEKLSDLLLWRSALERYNREHQERQLIFRSEIEPVLKDRVESMIGIQIDSGFLPISRERVSDLVARLEFNAVDLLNHPERAGRYRANTHEIDIVLDSSFPTANSWNPEDVEKLVEQYTHTYLHEIVHAISGHTILGVSEQDKLSSVVSSEEIGIHKNHVQKIGLLYMKGAPNNIAGYAGKEARFNWFNEAVTEYITRKVLSTDSAESPVYQSEVDFFELLKEKTGLTDELILQAYFEDYVPSEQTGDKVPCWNLLKKQIDESLGPDGLVKLDDALRGLKGPLLYMKGKNILNKTPTEISPLHALLSQQL